MKVLPWKLPHHHSIRNIAFFDADDPESLVKTFADDINYDFAQQIDWNRIQCWCECKDLEVDFKAKYKRYAQAFIRHLLSKYFRPATLQVRDMESMRFSIVKFDGAEVIALDDLGFFQMEGSRVVAR